MRKTDASGASRTACRSPSIPELILELLRQRKNERIIRGHMHAFERLRASPNAEAGCGISQGIKPIGPTKCIASWAWFRSPSSGSFRSLLSAYPLRSTAARHAPDRVWDGTIAVNFALVLNRQLRPSFRGYFAYQKIATVLAILYPLSC
jgi:hypothetical protein